jgi:hypothetical protein
MPLSDFASEDGAGEGSLAFSPPLGPDHDEAAIGVISLILSKFGV